MENPIEKYGITTRSVKEVVKAFVYEPDTYFGVTRSGFLFHIIKYCSPGSTITDPKDYFGYMLVETDKGYFFLRQRIVMAVALEWALEVELIPQENSPVVFEELKDFFQDNSVLIDKLCGEPVEQDLPDFSKSTISRIFQRQLEEEDDDEENLGKL